MRKIKELKNGYNTYTASFHQIKLHFEALQYHEKLEKKAFESAKQLLQEYLNDLEKQRVSQDDHNNPIGVQNVEAAS